MNSKIKSVAVWLPLAVALAFAIGMFVGTGLYDAPVSWNTREKISNIMNLVDEEYVDRVNTDSILEESIPDILAKLDPHTVYIPASELQVTNEVLDGSFGGIGVVFNMLTDTATVVEVVSGGPAEKVGMLAGDRIVEVDDSVVAGVKLDSEKLRGRLKGPKGTRVKLGVRRAGALEMLTYNVTRGDIPVTSVDAAYMIEPGVGYLRVNKFGRNTYSEFLDAMIRLHGQGAGSFVIDLRGNTGGFMEPAILMANEFLEGGMPIVSTRGRTPESTETIGSNGNGSFSSERLVVLIDESTASASEIFAGAMQDNDRGVVVGRRSFGKGLVQRQIDLPDSSALRLTTARYYTPSGRCIQKPYTPGSYDSYEMEIYDRYSHGEGFSADSAKVDRSRLFKTLGGRDVYGGGGIMPDVFVASDTSGVTPYYIKVFNAGLLHRYAFDFTDRHRAELKPAKDPETLLAMLPGDDNLLAMFAEYARDKGGIPPRWYYINISSELIVRQLKSLIASDVLGHQALFQVSNATDPTVLRALEEIREGRADHPILPQEPADSVKTQQ